ncbi:MAG TPA: ATP-binding protein [Methanosarcina sp.]|nr:ATP-binding protein [Methanosarcina sp.]
MVINERAKKSRHRKIFGSTGSGKSFSVCEMLQRALSFYQCRGCVITPKHEEDNFIALAKYYKERGKVIYMGEDGDPFNPVQIVIDEQVLGNSKKAYSKAYFRHVRNLKAGLQTWLNVSDTAKGYMESTIHWLYADNGIDRHKPETWKRETWPMLEDIWKKWDADSRDMSLSVQTRNIAASLAQRAAAIAPGGTFNYFNQQTTPIDYSNLDLIVFDISGVDEEIQDAVNVWVTGILGSRFNTDPNQETIIVVDEARVLLRNPELNYFLKDGIALGRSYGVWFWLITQNPSDFAKNNADEEFKMNIPISIIMGADIDNSNIDQVKTYFNLTDSQVEQLIGCQPGEGLLIVNGEVYLCRFEPATEEYATYKGLDVEEAVIPTMHFEGYKIKTEFQKVIDQSHLILREMIEGDESKLRDEGWIKKTRQPTIKGRGSCSVWYKKGELNGDLVNIEGFGKMTFEHLLGVVQVQTWLIEHGIKCEVNHNNEADVIFWVGDKTYAVEWEKAHSHTFEQLKGKLGRLLNDYEDFRFACAATPEEYEVINAAIPSQYMAPRGAALIQWLNEVTSGNMTKNTLPDNPFEGEELQEITFEEVKKRLPAFVWEKIYPNLEETQKEALVNGIKEKIRAGYYKEQDEIHTKAKEALREEEEQTQEQENSLNPLVSNGPEEIGAL